MSQVQANPEELRSFAARLESFSQNVADEASTTAAAFNSLGDSWGDSKRAEFEEIFNELLATIHRFNDACEEQIPYLHRLASHLEEYNSL